MNVNLMGIALLWWYAHKPEMFETSNNMTLLPAMLQERKQERTAREQGGLRRLKSRPSIQ